jgi:AraC-like DNA-binding protein
MLVDSRMADRSISAIAFDAGFGDLSCFNREFRRRFGQTPSDVRAAGARYAVGGSGVGSKACIELLQCTCPLLML